MFLQLCNLPTEVQSEICYLNLYNLIASIFGIVSFGLCGIYLYFKIKNICVDLLYLHNLRSSIYIGLLFVYICELGETFLGKFPPITGFVAPPLGLYNVLLSLIGTILLIGFVRLIEVRNKPIWLYLVVIFEVIFLIPKLWKYIRLTEDMDIYELQPLIVMLSSILFSLLVVTDAFTIYKTNTSQIGLRSSLLTNSNVGYKHPHATFISKLTFWWLTPLLWKGYWEPLELDDLGNLYEENTSRYQYDQFLFIYQSFKNKQTSLWLCYFKSCWKMFTLGGLLKLLGDFVVLIGPLSITRIVDYIEKIKNDTEIINFHSNITISKTNIISEIVNKSTIIYYPNWNEYLSNGWIVGIFVLISSILQGTLSQASTHIVNMVGIKLKIAIQGLVYRKTLLISSSCFFNNNNNNNNNSKNNSNSKINNNNNKNDNGRKNGKDNNNKQQIKEDDENNADAGTITNLMSEDAFNVMSFFWIAHYVWAIPLKISLVMYLLYQILGISAVIGSLVCIITMIPLQFFIGKIMSKNSKNASECTDERLRKLNEILLGIKIIKLNAWEKVFKERIFEARSKELKKLDLDSFYWAAITILTHVSSVLITFVTLAVFINIENDNDAMEFTAGRIFAALALFNQLTVPLFIFPITIPIIIGAIISTKRLEKFLRLPEVRKEFEGVKNMARILCRSDASLDIFETDQKNIDNNYPLATTNNNVNDNQHKNVILEFNTSETTTDNNSLSSFGNSLNDLTRKISTNQNLKIKLKKRNELSKSSQLERNRNKKTSLTNRDSIPLTLSEDHVVTIYNGQFSWHSNLDLTVLKVDKLEIPKGKLTIIVGKTGSGKSTLLAALLKEMNMISGNFQWNKYSTTAYVPQNPWLLNATIRDNILFGESFRPKRYDRVLEACALKPDIELMPGGDMTEIGERGINLSGGQRQRIALGRALYSSANVVIMDDALSALDNEVGQYIFENTIKKMLLRYRRTTILVTQKLTMINNADYIVAMENNNVRVCGILSEIENNDPKITQEWNSIMTKESLKEMQLSPGRTARERWKLFKNISRLGLQRGSATDDEDLSSSQLLYVPNKRRSSIYGSRHLTCDIPLPIDECNNEDLELRRHSFKRNPFIMAFDFDNHKNVLRANSLQVASKNHDRMPVIRNISSPIGLTYSRHSSKGAEDELNENKGGFRQFLRRLSTRNTSNSIANSVIYRDRKKLQRPTSTNSIQSINEEQHAPVKKLISTVSRYSEETEDEISDYNEEISTRYMSDEERKYGKIPTGIYRIYLKSCGLHIVFIFCLSAFGWQALRVYTDIWLRNWTDDDQTTNDVFYYFKIYGILSGVCMLLSFISTPAGQIGGSKARRIIHEKLVDAVLKKSLHFFQTTPIGRVLNRFSNDMSVIDKKIAATSQRLLQFILLCLCAILINTAITPWFILLTLPICAVYYVIQRFYRSSSRELQRIENITNSPVISHFSETIQGVTTIRAFNQESRFMELLFKQMEANNTAQIILNTSNRWLGIALDYLGGIIVFIAILTALSTSRIYPDETIPSLIGLAINYTLLVPIYLNWVVKLLSDMEMYIGAVERIQCFIESENNKENIPILYKSVPISWPQRGNIVYNNVSLSYENQKENVIKNFNINIPAGQKIGICGRTGSGKSSFVLSLFGVLNITDGSINIDDVDISSIHVDELRSRLSIIPQDVVLFGGTIRENLDPRRHYTDLELWNCLETAQLKDTISVLSTGLDTEIIEGGSNLSTGQKQLFCLARAVLKGSACLILDEATSSLDTTTEIELIKAANKAFEGRTIITIAHRVSTLLEYDRVIVFDNGQIVEDGDPQILKNKTNGRFYAMLKATTIK